MTREMRETVRCYFVLQATTGFGMAFVVAFYAMFDVFGRKFSYVTACTLLGAGMFIYGSADSFWGFIAAEMVCAVGSTFASGAFTAWLVDRLRGQGFTGSLSHIFAREQQVNGVTRILAAILGAATSNRDMALPWFVGGACMILAALIATAYMRETDAPTLRRSLSGGGLYAMRQTIVSSALHIRTSGAMRFVLIASAAQQFAMQAPNMQWQPLFGEFLHDRMFFGILFGGIVLATMAGATLAPAFLRNVRDERRAILYAQVATGLCICATVVASSFGFALGAFLAHEVARGLFVPLKDVYLNDNIPSKERATLMSFDQIARHIGGMIGLLVSGALAHYVALSTAWIVSGAALVAVALALLRRRQRV
ncbi:MAG: MFS transporter [Patescibacteria group bacterium]